MFFCVDTTIFFHNHDNDRTQFFTATKWMHQLARAYVIPVIHTTATQLVRPALPAWQRRATVDHNVDQSDEGFLSLARLRLARRHTPLRYRFAHAVDHNVDDSADGLRPDSHRRSEEIDEASYGYSTRDVRRLVEGGDVGPKPRQTPFTLSLLESRGVVLESGGPVRPVS